MTQAETAPRQALAPMPPHALGPTLHRALSPFLCLALALVTVRCGEPPAPPPPLQRLELQPLPGSMLEPVSTVADIQVPSTDDFPGMTTTADSWEIVPHELLDGSQVDVLHVQRGDTMRVRMPGSGFDPREVTEALLKVVVRAPARYQLVLVRDKQPVFKTDAIRIEGRDQVHEILFDFEDLEDLSPVDSVLVEMPARWMRGTRIAPGDGKWVGIAGLELRKRPPSRRLPDPAEPARLVTLGPESRLAVGLVPDRPLTTTLRPVKGSRLEMAWGVPQWVRDEATLRLSLMDEDGDLLHQQLLEDNRPPAAAPAEEGEDAAEPSPRPGTGRWLQASLPLDDWAGETLEARFDLLAEGAGSTAAIALTEPRVVLPKAQPRTVLLITSDTHRADHLGVALDGVGVSTPFLDSLAGRGLFFEDATSASNLTNPGHISILAGIPPQAAGVYDNVSPLSHQAVTLAEAFHEAGYATWAAVSTRHLANDMSGLGQGFERMASPAETQRDSSETLALLDSWWPDADGRDLFVWLHVFDVHGPYQSHPEFDELYYPADKDPYDPALPEIPPHLLHRDLVGLRDLEHPVALYKSEVSYQDAVLARFLEQLPRDDTLLAFTADHGEALLEHRAWFTHGELYPATLRIPLFLSGPGVPTSRTGVPVSSIDLGRTLLDLAGLTDTAFPGRNLVQLAEASDRGRQEPRFALSVGGDVAAIFADQWYLALHLRAHTPGNVPPPVPEHFVELFDVSVDPDCQTNVAQEHPDVVRRLRSRVVAWLTAVEPLESAAPQGAMTADMVDGLAELGYLEVEAGASGRALMDPDCSCPQCAEFR